MKMTILLLFVVSLVGLVGCKSTEPAPTDQELNDETWAHCLATLTRADSVYAAHRGEGDSAAVTPTLDWFNNQSNVDTARQCIDWWTIDVLFNNSVRARYHTQNPDSAGIQTSFNPPGLVSLAAPFDTIVLYDRAYVLAPFDGQGQYRNAAQLVNDTLEHYGWTVTLRFDSAVTVDSLQQWMIYDPGLFAVFSHGSASPDSGDTVVFWTSEPADPETLEYYGLISSGEILIAQGRGGNAYYAITPRFIANHARFSYPGIVYVCACYNGQNRTMADAFLNAGAKAYLSFSGRVRFDHGFAVTRDLFNALADTSTVQQAYDNLPNARSCTLYTNSHAEYMIGPNFTCNRHNTRDHLTPSAVYSTLHYEGQPIDAVTVNGTVSPDGADTVAVLNVLCDRSPGSHSLSSGHCLFAYITAPPTKDFVAGYAFVGVSGQVTMSGCGPVDSCVAAGYSATLGWWSASKDPTEDPPDETMQVSGHFKVIVRAGLTNPFHQGLRIFTGWAKAEPTFNFEDLLTPADPFSSNPEFTNSPFTEKSFSN